MQTHPDGLTLEGPRHEWNPVSLSSQPENPQHTRAYALPAWLLSALYWVPVVLTCAWVLSLPVWPSQDGPLHLYYANILKQLMAHQPGVYADTYFIKSRVTPYSAYYHGLLLLNRVVSLETADKLIVCLYLLVFAASTRILLRTVGGSATLSSFLCLPVLLNWPVTMGFLNYSLSTCLAFLALAIWCRGIGQPRLWPRALFLLLVCLIMVTHPVPWMIVVSFAWLELALRLARSASERYRQDAQPALRSFRADLVTAVLACVPYLYLHRFKAVVQTLEPPLPIHWPAGLLPRIFSPAALEYVGRAQQFLRTLGVDVFVGGTLLPRLYRLGIDVLLLVALGFAVYNVWHSYRRRTWPLTNTFLLFGVLLLPFLLFLPDPLQGRYYFAVRMGIILVVAIITAASSAVRGRLGIVVAAGACALWLFSLSLAHRYITPAAQAIDSLRQAPAPPADGTPGLVMRPVGADAALGLNFLPDNWAFAHYYRRNNRVLYNTAWLGDPIILVGVRPAALPHLDTTYYESVPWFGSVLLPGNSQAAAILRRVGFVTLMRQSAPPLEHPFAAATGQTSPAPYGLGWTCQHGPANAWYVCTPPANRLEP